MPSNSNSNSLQKSLGARILTWALTMGVIVIVGTMVVLSFGSVNGTEVNPLQFTSRTFVFYRVPFTSLQISPTWYGQTSHAFEQSIIDYLPTARSRKQQWQVADIWYGGIHDFGDAKIMDDLFWIVESPTREDSDYWSDWSSDHPEVAKLFWPVISELGAMEAHLVMPNFVNAVRSVENPDQFKAVLLPDLLTDCLGLASNFSEASQPNEVIKLTTFIIKHDPKNQSAFTLRAAAYDKLGKTDLAAKDREFLQKLN